MHVILTLYKTQLRDLPLISVRREIANIMAAKDIRVLQSPELKTNDLKQIHQLSPTSDCPFLTA